MARRFSPVRGIQPLCLCPALYTGSIEKKPYGGGLCNAYHEFSMDRRANNAHRFVHAINNKAAIITGALLLTAGSGYLLTFGPSTTMLECLIAFVIIGLGMVLSQSAPACCTECPAPQRSWCGHIITAVFQDAWRDNRGGNSRRSSNCKPCFNAQICRRCYTCARIQPGLRKYRKHIQVRFFHTSFRGDQVDPSERCGRQHLDSLLARFRNSSTGPCFRPAHSGR